ncbi:hypothetical protein [Arthrobacter sp. RCC_34]|uniref:hypothetical protein n=1 Tax=Arthrobacter sp. RCC_34 TaxID=3239230 RepID=UPI00352478E8
MRIRPIRRGNLKKAGTVIETVILLASLLYVVTNEIWALMVWELIAALYLLVGGIVMWRANPRPLLDRHETSAVMRWMWLPPVLSAIVGANSAVTALLIKNSGTSDGLDSFLVIAACLGIVLS